MCFTFCFNRKLIVKLVVPSFWIYQTRLVVFFKLKPICSPPPLLLVHMQYYAHVFAIKCFYGDFV